MTDEDALTALAFSMKSTPGAYVAVLGAGVSAPSGIPTAWGVLVDLVGRLADLRGAPSDDAMLWYEQTFGEPARYERVLELLAPSQVERQRLLRGYFEPDAGDPDATPLVPTAAHRSLARLVRLGVIRVIVTLNFDRLVEQAIRDEGIEPTVISTPTDAAAAAPVHTIECCVVHLHGDYLNPASMLNTVTELEEYHEDTRALASRIIGDHGLLIAGWSAVYDPALSNLMKDNHRGAFTGAWIEPATPSPQARDLAKLLRSTTIRTDADTAFGWLSDAVESMLTRRSRHPLTVPVAVQTAKRALAGGRVAVDLHDLLGRELATLSAHHHLHLPRHDDDTPWGGLDTMSAQLSEAATVPSALIATAAYWGTDGTDRWWVAHLERFADQIHGSGLTNLLELPRVAGTMLFYAGGVAAVAAGRYDVVGTMLRLRHRSVHDQSRPLVAQTLAGESAFAALGGSAGLYERLVPVLAETIISGTGVIEQAWQRFEVAVAAAALMVDPRFGAMCADAQHARALVRSAQIDVDLGDCREVDLDTAQRALVEAEGRYTEALDSLSLLCPLAGGHVLATDLRVHGPTWRAPVAEDLAREIDQADGGGIELVRAGLGLRDDLAAATRAVSLACGRAGRELAYRPVLNSVGTVASSLWIDSGQTPRERNLDGTL